MTGEEKAEEENNVGISFKKSYEELEKENEELKAQIEQLSNDNHVLKTAFITQQEQNDKLKCCGNCKYIEFRYFVENMKVKNMINYCSDCIRFIKKNKKDKWELAE